MKRKHYICDHCGGRFPYEDGWDDDDAEAERAANGWADIPDEYMCCVCDDCYKKVMAARN